jgi:hypothetical protein
MLRSDVALCASIDHCQLPAGRANVTTSLPNAYSERPHGHKQDDQRTTTTKKPAVKPRPSTAAVKSRDQSDNPTRRNDPARTEIARSKRKKTRTTLAKRLTRMVEVYKINDIPRKERLSGQIRLLIAGVSTGARGGAALGGNQLLTAGGVGLMGVGKHGLRNTEKRMSELTKH